MQNLVVEYEKFQRDRLPICSELAGHLIETSCTIMDLKGVGIAQFWKVKNYVQEAAASESRFVFREAALFASRGWELTFDLPVPSLAEQLPGIG